MSHLDYVVQPGGALTGRLRVPGDKSVSHRAIMLGALAEGVTEIENFLSGADCLATLHAFRDMGVRIEGPDTAGQVRVYGAGLHGLREPPGPLDLGNSGTSMRLLCGLLAGQRFSSTLIGDRSLMSRPMRRVTEPLTRMGARIATSEQGTAPLRIAPAPAGLRGMTYTLPVASAQVKSCLLLAGLYASGQTCVTEPAPTRDHTERLLRAMGGRLQQEGATICLQPGTPLRALSLRVPADLSSAAFFLVGASIAPGSELVLEGVGVNPTRSGGLDILRQMGADIMLVRERVEGGEPVADIHVRSATGLRGVRIPEALVPLAIDEFPALFVAAACATGETLLTGARELRVKESDRIAVMADGLSRLGIVCEVLEDGLRIQGRGSAGDSAKAVFDSAEVDSHGDHRVAMAFAMAALRARGPLCITDCANVATSFPGFESLARAAGLGITRR